MEGFTLRILTLAVLLAAAAATTTTVEIVNMVVAEGSSQGCRQEMERQRLSSCREYLRDSSRMMMPGNEGGRGWREEFPRCCDELEQISQQCRCQAVKQVAQEQRRGGGLQGREMREMLQTAQSLPSLCRISPHHCQNVGGPMF